MSRSRTILVSYGLLFFGWIIFSSESVDPSDQSTNAPFDGFCIACHTPSTLDGDISISGIPPIVDAGVLYSVTVSISTITDSAVNAGFQMVSVFDTDLSNAGDFQPTGVDVGTASAGNREYIEHRNAKNFDNNQVSWTFDWQAPNGPNGAVIEMYYAGLIANGSGVEGDKAKSGNTFFTLSAPSLFAADITSQTDIKCHGQLTGSATVSAENGPRPYRYDWSNGAHSASINNLPAGAYSVTVTDNNGDTATAIALITEPDPFAIQAASTDVDCFGENNGFISLAVLGGVGAYTYEWSNGSNAGILVVGAGDYRVTVTDANGCILEDSTTVEEPDELVLNINKSDETNNDANDGVASAEIMGGVPPYQYIWNTGEDSTLVDDLSPGIYTLTVTDQNGCAKVETVVIESFTCALEAAIESQHLNCQAEATGSAKVVVVGGAEPITYIWSNGQTGDSIGQLSAGSYGVTINDADNCQSILSTTIQEPTLLRGSIESIDPICPEDSSGSLTILPLGGSGAYSFAWSSGGQNSTEVNLNAGDYQVTVTDANGCEVTLFGALQAHDTIPPSAASGTSTVYLDSNGLLEMQQIMLNLVGTDNCGIDSFWLQQGSFNCEDLDTQSVLLSVSDAAGNTGQAFIDLLVKDTIAPVFGDCLSDLMADSGAILSYRIPTAADNCAVDSIFLVEGQASGSVFPVGETRVTFRAVDESGNAGHCSFFVQVDGDITSTVDQEFSNMIAIYPNPVGDHLRVNFLGGNNRFLSVKIYDARGLFREEIIAKNEGAIEIDATNWPSGMHFLSIKRGEKIAMKKVIKR